MAIGKYQVIWTRRAQRNMQSISDHISLDSAKNAVKVIESIIAAVDKAIANPEMYPADKNVTNNNGRFRAFEKYSYRVGYFFDDSSIKVLRVVHVKREPKTY